MEDSYVRHNAKERGMPNHHCPVCGSNDVVQRTVNDRLRAADPVGQTFEIPLLLPVWRCKACKLCWQGEEALAAKEAAYQYALVKRAPSQNTA
jgi:ribosomal protein L37AE/L43A